MSFSLQKNYDEETENLQKNQSSNTESLAEIKNTKSNYILDPKYIYIIGFIAGLLTSIAFAPQVFKAFKDKEKTETASLNWLTAKGWREFTSGFIVGGFSGASIAYILLKIINVSI